jgi:hypothetical protein
VHDDRPDPQANESASARGREHAATQGGRPLRVGLLGPARARVGTGPFLARWLERSGLHVVAAAGRDLARTTAAARELDELLADDALRRRERDATRPFASLAAMLTEARPDVLVVASPPDSHRDALRAALAMGGEVRAVLCEKPLVRPDEMGSVDALLDGFVAADVLLVENCQWPFALGAFDALWPGLIESRGVRRIAMGLSPVGHGLDMVLDSLSHVLSVVQAVVRPGPGARVFDVRFATRDEAAEQQVVEFRLGGADGADVSVALTLRRAEVQPRPAWIAVDGKRVDRRIRVEDYGFGFSRGEGEDPEPRSPVAFATGDPAVVEVPDPMGALVRHFADAVSALPDAARVAATAAGIRQRCRMYADVLGAW